MLEQARAMASQESLANVKFLQGDATDLPFPDATYDLVTCRLAIHHFPRPELVVAEMARVVVPGGMMSIYDLFHKEGEWCWWTS